MNFYFESVDQLINLSLRGAKRRSNLSHFGQHTRLPRPARAGLAMTGIIIQRSKFEI